MKEKLQNSNIDEQAAEWIVLLTSDDETERKTAAKGYIEWKSANPLHAAAASNMERYVDQMQMLRGESGKNVEPVRTVLAAAFPKKSSKTKRVAMSLAFVFVIVSMAFTLQTYPPAYILADLRTPTGEWKTQTLSDGSRITLASASAVNIEYDEKQRAIKLVQGEILVDVAKDASRPFLVKTPHGSIKALGTHFIVDRDKTFTLLTMLESKVLVQTAKQIAETSMDAQLVIAGQRIKIRPESLGIIEEIDSRSASDSWKFHQLVVNNRPLAEVLDNINRYRPGYIKYDATQIQGLNVTAVLPLDNTDHALQLLQRSFGGLRIRTLTPYLVLVDRPLGE